MSRFGKLSTTFGAGIAAIALFACAAPSSAEAGCGRSCCTHHRCCVHYRCGCHHRHRCGCGVCVTGCVSTCAPCVSTNCVSAAPVPTANQFAYDLSYTDAKGQTQSAGRFLVTVSDVSTDWGGLDKAQNALAAQGLKTTYSAEFLRTVAMN